jgi:uncharacterized repeat protein (TIGR01451 family)
LLSCGGGTSQLTVSVRALSGSSVKGGKSPSYAIEVVNQGPGEASGVGVRVDLPADFRYQSTNSITIDSAVRIEATDPEVRSPAPQWALWTLSAPSTSTDGSVHHSVVRITFTALAAGKPGDYTVVAHAGSESASTDISSTPLAVHLAPAASLSSVVVAVQNSAHPGDTVTYRVTVLNDGTGPASGVNVLLSLPSSLAFSRTASMQGNFSRSGSGDPTAGSLLVYYSGFTIPARGDAGPGRLAIVFDARVGAGASGGRYTLTGQLTDSDGEVVPVDDAAPITVLGATPSASPAH